MALNPILGITYHTFCCAQYWNIPPFYSLPILNKAQAVGMRGDGTGVRLHLPIDSALSACGSTYSRLFTYAANHFII